MAKAVRSLQQTVMSKDGKAELAQSYGALSEYLKKLEVENRKLAVDLERKKKDRVARETARQKDGVLSRERLEAIARHIDQTDEAARRQRAFLTEMQDFLARHEKRLATIGERVALVVSTAGPQDASVSELKTDLLGILGELGQMRRRREQLMTQA